MKRFLVVALAASISQATLAAQPAPAAQTPAPAPAGGRQQAVTPRPAGAGVARSTPPRTTSVRVSVRDAKGESLEGVRLILSGGAEGEYETAAAGTAVLTNIKDGLYRITCERKGFITLEREFSIKGGALTPIDIVLNPAPPPPAPPPPPPASAPATAGSAGPPVNVNIPDYLDRNFIGRDPIKESVLACKPAETVRLLQLRDNVAEHVHDKADEVLYVVAGDGTLRIGDQNIPLKAGSLAVVPQGVGHALERRGKNPLILVSTLSGASCHAGSTNTP
jgi:mannose-6-phosphate isomerase-like protein (cupin superfamily)